MRSTSIQVDSSIDPSREMRAAARSATLVVGLGDDNQRSERTNEPMDYPKTGHDRQEWSRLRDKRYMPQTNSGSTLRDQIYI